MSCWELMHYYEDPKGLNGLKDIDLALLKGRSFESDPSLLRVWDRDDSLFETGASIVSSQRSLNAPLLWQMRLLRPYPEDVWTFCDNDPLAISRHIFSTERTYDPLVDSLLDADYDPQCFECRTSNERFYPQREIGESPLHPKLLSRDMEPQLMRGDFWVGYRSFKANDSEQHHGCFFVKASFPDKPGYDLAQTVSGYLKKIAKLYGLRKPLALQTSDPRELFLAKSRPQKLKETQIFRSKVLSPLSKIRVFAPTTSIAPSSFYLGQERVNGPLPGYSLFLERHYCLDRRIKNRSMVSVNLDGEAEGQMLFYDNSRRVLALSGDVLCELRAKPSPYVIHSEFGQSDVNGTFTFSRPFYVDGNRFVQRTTKESAMTQPIFWDPRSVMDSASLKREGFTPLTCEYESCWGSVGRVAIESSSFNINPETHRIPFNVLSLRYNLGAYGSYPYSELSYAHEQIAQMAAKMGLASEPFFGSIRDIALSRVMKPIAWELLYRQRQELRQGYNEALDAQREGEDGVSDITS